MFWIILTGILTAGIIPIFATIGFGIELIINIFTPVSWGYWENAAVGFIIAILLGGSINIKFRKGKEITGSIDTE